MIWHTREALLLLILLFLAVLYWFVKKNKTQASMQFSSVKNIRNYQKTFKTRFARLPEALKIISFVLMIIALARPQKSDTRVKKNIEGHDIVIAFDVSDSMLIEDMRPENRLEAAKLTVKKFIQNRTSDRIGLVVFSGEAYTRVPLTLDYPLLIKSVEEIQTSRTIKMGTALGVALANASSRLKDSTAKTRIVIFMTDGENNSGTIDPETALDIAKGYGLKVYAIGIGKDGETQIPVYITDPLGNKIKRYQPFTSYVNDELLGLFAKETGGKYYRATNEKALDEIFKDIDRLEKTKIDVNKFTRYEELFMSYLFWAIVLYLLSVILSKTYLRRFP